MSGFDAAAGVAGIASAGMLVAKGLIQLADGIGSAGKEVRMCASDTALFSQMLENLADAPKLPSAASRATQSTTEDLIDVCERILYPFQRLTERLTPLLEKYRESEHQLRQIGLRIQWYFRHKSKVTFYQQALAQLKATLTCLLASMNLQEARASSPQKIFIYQMEVENSRASIAQQTRGERAALVQPTPDLQIDGQLVLSGSRIEDVSESEWDESPHTTGDQITNRGELDPHDAQALERDIDDDASHDTAVAIRIDLLSLQRKILKIATSALTPLNDSRGQSFVEPSLQRSESDDKSSKQSNAHSNPSTVKERASSSSEVVGSSGAVILTDPSGKQWVFPYEECKTTEGISRMIASSLGRDARFREILLSQRYDLYLNNEAYIPDQYWGDILSAGAHVTLRVNDEDQPYDDKAKDGPKPNRKASIARSSPLQISLGDPIIEHPQQEKLPNIGLIDSWGFSYRLPFELCQRFRVGTEFSSSHSVSSLLPILRDMLAMLIAPSQDFENILIRDICQGDAYFESDSDQWTLKPYIITHEDGTRILSSVWDSLIKPGWTVMINFTNPDLNSKARNDWLTSRFKDRSTSSKLSVSLKQSLRNLVNTR